MSKTIFYHLFSLRTMRLFSQSNSLRLTWKDSVMAQNVSVMEKCFLGLIFCIKPRKKVPAGIQAYCLYCSIPRPPRCTLGLQNHSFCSGWRSEKLPSGSTWRELRYLCQISVSGEIKMCLDAYLVFGPENAVGFFWLLSLKAQFVLHKFPEQHASWGPDKHGPFW